MSVLRDDLKAVLTAAFPDYDVLPSIPENITRPTFALAVSGVTRLAEAPASGWYRVAYSLVIASPLEDIEKADEQMDAILLDVFEALQTDDPLALVESATAEVLNDTHFCYNFSLSRGIKIGA